MMFTLKMFDRATAKYLQLGEAYQYHDIETARSAMATQVLLGTQVDLLLVDGDDVELATVIHNLSDDGRAALRASLAAVHKLGDAMPEQVLNAYASDMELNCRPGSSGYVEVRISHSADGRPHVIEVPADLFELSIVEC